MNNDELPDGDDQPVWGTADNMYAGLDDTPHPQKDPGPDAILWIIGVLLFFIICGIIWIASI